MHPRVDRLWYAVGLLLAAVPLWATSKLPLVDLPQHLHLISVLHRLDDPTTLYPSIFEVRGELTPYLGYYYLVSLLNWLVPLELANRLFLTVYVVGLPLALALLLRALRRPTWPSLLGAPFAYGDSLAWGFINFCAALPLAIATCAVFVTSISDATHRRRWAVALAIGATAVLLFHVQVYAFLALALPFLLLTTAAPEDHLEGRRTGWRDHLRARAWALIAVVPSVVLFFVWVVLRAGKPAEIERGAPWKAWGPMLSPENLAYKSFEQNLRELPVVLMNHLRDGSDRWVLVAVVAVAAAGLVVGLLRLWRERPVIHRVEGARISTLAVLALGLYFLLPFDIRGYSYYLNTRYAHLFALLAVVSLPVAASVMWRRRLLWASVAVCGLLAVLLGRGFAQFGAEAAALEELVPLTEQRPRVMGLVYNPGSRIVGHPVYLHSAAVLAQEKGGLTNFSFALTPHSPVKYRDEPPPTFASEWRPDQFRYETQGGAYDHFLVVGMPPERVFGPLLQSELAVAGRAGNFWLVRRRR